MSNKLATFFCFILCAIVGIACFSGVFEGESAYEIAVRNGYTGTEIQWLDTLQGDDGLDGEYAGRGLSAYEIACENGFDGSEVEWVLSLKSVGGVSDLSYVTSVAIQSIVSVNAEFSTSTGTLVSSGAGVIFELDQEEGDAYIITNYHVVYNSDGFSTISNNVEVFLFAMEYDEYSISATYIGGSMNYDIAVLKVNNNNLVKEAQVRAVDYIDSNTITVGDTAIAIGNPDGAGISVTSGVVSVDSEEMTMDAVDGSGTITFRSIRMDTPINSGNSGGGLFNQNGKLIGIVNAKIVDDKIDDMSYAIPCNLAVGVADNIIDAYERQITLTPSNTNPVSLKKYLLGIATSIDDSKSVYNTTSGKIEIVETVCVNEVSSGASAQGILHVDDIIKSVKINSGDQVDITRSFTLSDYMLNARLNDVIYLTIERGGIELNVQIIVTNYNEIE